MTRAADWSLIGNEREGPRLPRTIDAIVEGTGRSVGHSPNIRAVATLALQRLAGWRVTEADWESTVLALAVMRPRDAVGLDKMMPGMDGAEAVAALHAEAITRDGSVVLLTVEPQAGERGLLGWPDGAATYGSAPPAKSCGAVPVIWERVDTLSGCAAWSRPLPDGLRGECAATAHKLVGGLDSYSRTVGSALAASRHRIPCCSTTSGRRAAGSPRGTAQL